MKLPSNTCVRMTAVFDWTFREAHFLFAWLVSMVSLLEGCGFDAILCDVHPVINIC